VLFGQVLDADFKMVPEAAWLQLKAWYNSFDIEYPRTVIMRGYMESIEIHPQSCKVRECGGDGEPLQSTKSLLVSRHATGTDLLDKVSKALGVSADATRRLWIKASCANCRCVCLLPTLCVHMTCPPLLRLLSAALGCRRLCPRQSKPSFG
jgi:hypothetical protein